MKKPMSNRIICKGKANGVEYITTQERHDKYGYDVADVLGPYVEPLPEPKVTPESVAKPKTRKTNTRAAKVPKGA